MKIFKTKKSTEHLCDKYSLHFATCPKAEHIKFGNGIGNDNVIECSEHNPTKRGNDE